MPKFSVWVKKVYATRTTIEVEANSPEEADKLAITQLATIDKESEFIYEGEFETEVFVPEARGVTK